jgi:hypothetical protein
MPTCPHCGTSASGNFCTACGQPLQFKRITLHSVIHEVFHFFTHLDKGFPYTLKQLMTQPGTMQRQYFAGQRARHQKPFSMYFICITVAALGMYWIDKTVLRWFDAGEAAELTFFNKYLALVQVLMLPFYALVVFIFFRKAGYNYAEISVQQLYTFSFLFLMVMVIHLLKFIWPSLQTRYVELPAIVAYVVWTNFHFFTSLPRWQVVLLSLVATGVCFAAATMVQDALVKQF